MHKYQPRLHVVACDGDCNQQQQNETTVKQEDAKNDIVRMFVFPETEFMAVTAYQNHMVIPLEYAFGTFANYQIGFRCSKFHKIS